MKFFMRFLVATSVMFSTVLVFADDEKNISKALKEAQLKRQQEIQKAQNQKAQDKRQSNEIEMQEFPEPTRVYGCEIETRIDKERGVAHRFQQDRIASTEYQAEADLINGLTSRPYGVLDLNRRITKIDENTYHVVTWDYETKMSRRIKVNCTAKE